MSGLTALGLIIETPDEIRESINAELVVEIGPQLDLTDGSLQGKVIAIVSNRIGLAWEALGEVYAARDPDQATDAAQDALCAITGTRREEAVPSQVTLTLTGTPTTAVAAGSQAAIADAPDDVFETDAIATIGAALTVWAISTAYVVGDRRRSNTAPDRCYQALTAGTSGVGPLQGNTATVFDGVLTWRYLGDGTGVIDVAATALETGPLVALAGAITSIVTPVSGWLGVNNAADAATGRDSETSEVLRLRREAELASGGTGTLDALRDDLLAVGDGTATPVTSVRIFNNTTLFTDSDGVPGKAFEALVVGGVDQEIRDTILAGAPLGIESHGTTSGSATDSQGFTHTIEFSRPTAIPIFVDVVLVKNTNAALGAVYPSDGDAQVKAAVALFGNSLAVGRDVVATALIAPIYGVSGVIGVSVPEIDDAAAPTTTTTVVITERQRATFDVTNITVATSVGTP